MSPLPPYVSRVVVQERLPLIFLEGLPFRNYCIRDMAGATVFTMLYIGAVEGSGRFLAPKQVYKMSDAQAAMTSDDARLQYAAESRQPGFEARGKAWYADNSREPIRDETLRQGLMTAGAAVAREDLPVTSSKPRYALARDFAALFDPTLTGNQFTDAIVAWQRTHLSQPALARVELLRAGGARDTSAVSVTFPNGETRRLSAGPSSIITKAVVEELAPRFLEQPTVLWLSESGNKVVARDDILAKRIGLRIETAKTLPDIILIDLGRPGGRAMLVFVEVVATDGPVSEARRIDLLAPASDAGFAEADVAFVTAFMDRGNPAFRKALSVLAWNTFVWFASEPDRIVALLGHEEREPPKLHAMLALAPNQNS